MKGYMNAENCTGERWKEESPWIALLLADALLSDDGTVFDRLGDMFEIECGF